MHRVGKALLLGTYVRMFLEEIRFEFVDQVDRSSFTNTGERHPLRA